MQTCPAPERLKRFLDEQLADADAAAVTRHVETCAACRGALDRLSADADSKKWRRLRESEPQTDGESQADFLRRLEGVLAPGSSLTSAALSTDCASRDAEARADGFPTLPGYEIVEKLGRGGTGVVYKARDLRLKRTVAIKMLLTGGAASAEERARLRAEAEAVAGLQHPNIIQIYEIGEHDGCPFLVLEFVEGSLSERLGGTPQPPRDAAGLLETVARAVHYAHEHGVVHRDLKPGNILLGKDEGGRMKDESEKEEKAGSASSFILHPSSLPKVTDFGLAKRIDETVGDGGTRTGAVLGTPSYIAPEQAGGKARDVGPATDVYALGAILYELLTGRPPFRGETPLETVLQVLHDDPVPPKRLHPLVPRDLETICLKCLSKQPAQRYASAAALADDLRRFLNGEPIKARPLSAWGRGVKWARRHPSLAVLLLMTVAATVALVSVLSVSYFRIRDAVAAREHETILAQRERDRAEVEKRRAQELAAENEKRRADAVQKAVELREEAEQTRRAAYALQLAQVAIICERDPLRAAALLDDEARCPKDLRDFTWRYLRRLCQRDDRAYLDHQPDDPLRAVAYAPTGTFAATAGDAGSIRVWDPRTGRTWLVLSGHAGAVHALAFSPDGTTLASAGADHTVRLWVLPVDVLDTARKLMSAAPWLQPIVKPAVLTPTLTLPDAHAGEVLCVAFSPDGRSLVSGGQDGALRWWELTGWRPAPTDVAGLGGPGAAALSLASAARSPDAQPVWARGTPVPAHAGGVLCLAFSRNGRFLVSGGADRFAKVWTGDGARLVRNLPSHADAVRAVAVTHDGGTVATVNNPATDTQPPTVRLFNTQTWRERRLFGHTKSIYALATSDDGQLLASAGFDKSVRLWDIDDGRERGNLAGHAQQVNALAFAPDRRTLVSVGMDGAAVVWQTAARTHEPEDLLKYSRDLFGKVNPQGLTAVGVGGGGTGFVVADDTGRVRMLAADYTPPGRTPPPPGPPGPLALSMLPYFTQLLKSPPRAAGASPDGRTFVVALEGGGLLVWQPFPFAGPPRFGGPPRGTFTRGVFVRTPAPVHAVAIDPSGRWLATADPAAVRLYDIKSIPATTELPIDLKGGTVVASVRGARELAFHPTRDWLAVAVGTGVRIVTREGKVLADVPRAHGPRATVESLAFDRAGTQLATGDASGAIKLWSLDAQGGLTFLRDLPGHAGAVYALAFSPDGLTLASGGDDRGVTLWDPVARRERLSLTGHADRVLKLAFNADGSALVTVSRDGAVKRWRADVRPMADSGPRLPPSLPGT